ncbi:lysine-sensitive aspartokinase 3 [Candidatus Woesearchaeota archaeon]|nr:lysine-sensitive aspartokinase 3 [Candidatus Woesearchaeota archaeon]
MKFGGSSLGDAKRIKNVCSIIKSRLGDKPIVVLSAVQGVTDMLIDTAKKAENGEDVSKGLDEIRKRHYDVLKELDLDIHLVDEQLEGYKCVVDKISIIKKTNPELMDDVQSFGERMSVRIVAAYLNKTGIEAQAYDAYNIGMITTPDYGKAEPLPDTEERIEEEIRKVKGIPVVTGFIGKDSAGNITTLGRGGSDYTAAIIGAAVGETIEIWTDVNGIMSADPRVVKEAKTIDKVSFDEASELAYFGARVLHPKTIWPAIKKNIPVRVLNSFEPKHKGTTIVNEASKSRDVIKAIACKKNISLINVNSTRMLLAHGFLARLFSVFEDYKKSVDMISTSEVSVSLTVDNDNDLDKIKDDLDGVAEVKVEKDKAIVCVVGEGMNNAPGMAGKVFSVMGRNRINIEMISQGASEINISFIVDVKDADKAVKILHKEFFGQG